MKKVQIGRANLWVCLYFKVALTERAFHSELEDGCGVVLAHLCFLSVEPHAHTNVTSTPTTPHVERELKPIISRQSMLNSGAASKEIEYL